MPLGLRAIRPKRLVLIDTAQIKRDLPAVHRRYLLEVAGEMSKYPPQQGSRYRRTGNYGRGWTAPGAIRVDARGATLVNRIPYAVYVGGPWPQGGRQKGERQTQVMHKRGWQTISVVARKTKKRYVGLVNRAIRGRPG